MQSSQATLDPIETPNHYRSLLALEPIRFPGLARPEIAKLKAKYPGIREIVGEDTSPTGETVLDLGTVLKPDETYIDGATYAARREALQGLTLGYQHAEWIVAEQDKLPDWFKALLGKVYIDFPGIVVLDEDDRRYFPYLDEDGERWYLHWHWAGHGLDAYGRVAVSGK
jgi:hypothetical protein